ncbi:MAG: iron-sulfur cluster repair di-iron protein [Phenylobacterium sp.]|uniref:hemerythrin domain-containing protein n=1 Tax=Phenylobacterium sp. TaxID=1871053 RepID=UPI0025FED31E|nr:hemerythrin domain-containing protein [Phenylobacterium sp.]MBI1197944.1 iron-sulfur cluster repair di-iron protein [Phenylobacterium sp.]
MYEETSAPIPNPAVGGAAIRCAFFPPPPANDAPADVKGLIDLILTRYHDTHRRELPQAIAMARKVEAVHAGDAECPRGLADHLAFMADDLESHQQREEQVLFPMILGGGSPMIRFPIGRMMAEHADVEEQLVRLRALTHDHSAPPGACATWRALVIACRKLDFDLREHMRLENEVLFEPFLT